ncbi:hypothetical protein UlMin_007110 [Ulmus minor]
MSWILNAISKDIADSIMYVNNACDMWTDLHERFHQSNGPRIFQLKQQIHALVQGSNDVSSYFTKLKTLWDELSDFRPFPACHCGGMKDLVDCQHQDYVLQFLMGLNESFSQIRAQILMIEPLPSINKIFSLVIQEEHQRSLNSCSVLPLSATVAQANVLADSTTSSLNSLSANQCQELISLLSHVWIIDLGATHHVCHDIRLFESFDDVTVTSSIMLPNGQNVDISRVGTVCLTPLLVLHNDNMQGLQIGMSNRVGNLYYLIFSENKKAYTSSYNSISAISIDLLWHYRLGYPACNVSQQPNKLPCFHNTRDKSFHCTVVSYTITLVLRDPNKIQLWNGSINTC